jgi:hypothetical protein
VPAVPSSGSTATAFKDIIVAPPVVLLSVFITFEDQESKRSFSVSGIGAT